MVDQPEPLRLEFHLLDRQIVDAEGMMVGNVDDIELEPGPDGAPIVTALLVGQRVLGQRLGGPLGRWLTALADRLSPHPQAPPLRIPYEVVRSVGSEIDLTVRRAELADPPLERWLREHLIQRIPGGRRARE